MDVKKSKESKNISCIVLCIITILQLVRIIYTFAFLKNDYHPDEPWTFGLANSYYEPYIYQDADETHLTHIRQWFSANEIKDYLTVDKEHRFSFGSVWYNQSKDMHPPFYYAVLHTICSFFPGKFSFWYGFVINIVAFVFLIPYLYKLTLEITKSEFASLSACVFFGFSSGAMNIFVFVRMYAMVAMFSTMTSYYHARLYCENNLKKNLPPIFALTLAGGLTHHFFFIYAGALSACFCIHYLFRKKIKQLFIYAGVMLLSVGSSVLIFPATITHFTERLSGDDHMVVLKLPYRWTFKIGLNCITNELMGIRFGVMDSATPVIIGSAMLVLIIIALPLIFLLRNEKWFKRFIFASKKNLSRIFSQVKINKNDYNMTSVFMLIASLVLLVVVTCSASVAVMDNYTDRYLFVIYPLVCVSVVCIFYEVLKLLVVRKKIYRIILLSVCCIFVILSNFNYPCSYLWTDHDESVKKYYKGADIIYLTKQYHQLTTLSKDIIDSNLIYLDSPDNFIKNINQVSDKLSKDNNDAYILIEDYYFEEETDVSSWGNVYNRIYSNKPITRSEFEDYLKQLNNLHSVELIGEDFFASYKTSIYRIR